MAGLNQRVILMPRPADAAGVAALEEFRSSLGRDEIARYLARFGTGTGVDSATVRLRSVTGGHLDLHDDGHRVALISWLRSWGCRHLRRADTDRTSEALRGWWAGWASRLPRDQDTLTGLGEDTLTVAGLAYDDLRARPAARRSVKGTDLDVAFGDTAAAKALYALRPRAFPPWDEPIRLAFGRPGGGAAYVRLLLLAAAALDGLAGRLEVPVGDLPEILGRPGSEPPKLVDEYLWVRITRGR